MDFSNMQSGYVSFHTAAEPNLVSYEKVKNTVLKDYKFFFADVALLNSFILKGQQATRPFMNK